jgi:hypothetical protein
MKTVLYQQQPFSRGLEPRICLCRRTLYIVRDALRTAVQLFKQALELQSIHDDRDGLAFARPDLRWPFERDLAAFPQPRHHVWYVAVVYNFFSTQSVV